MPRSCKLCDMLPNKELEMAVETMSDRQVALKFALGKTTVNKHKRKCLGTQSPKIDEPETDLQQVIWNGTSGELRTGALDQALADMSPEYVLKMFGYNVDEVELTGVLRERHSQYWSRDLNEMLWKHSYSFAVKRRDSIKESIDPIQLLKELGIKSKPKVKLTGGEESTWVLDWADWQVCKSEGGGSLGFIERFDAALESALKRIAELRSIGRKLDELVIIGGGDMIEGCTIYPQQSFHIDGHRRDQIRLTVATILKGLHTLAPLFESVRVIVVPGNHGENRINGKRTAIGDNDDLLVFEMAQVALEHDSNMSHVGFEIAEDEVSLVSEIRGWNYGVTHGDVYGRGGGTGVRNKVFAWFKTMAANRHPVGSADVLVTHHFHHDALEDWGATLWVQNPTMDGGSAYFVEATGHKPKHGMNSWVVTPQDRFQDKQVLR
jgi:hypothetical protein